jgi:hypothetical protein
MYSSRKTYVETDLASLYYVTFIAPLAVCPTEALSINYDQFTNNTINKVIEEIDYDQFTNNTINKVIEEIDYDQFTNNTINKVIEEKNEQLFRAPQSRNLFGVKKPYKFEFKDLSYEVLQFFSEP